MNSSEAIATLRRSQQVLHERGVTHAAVFGSVARGGSRSDSDIDIMIEVDPNARMTVFDYVDLKDYIAVRRARRCRKPRRIQAAYPLLGIGRRDLCLLSRSGR
jgi:predicted nucleotidyltransferase